MNSSVFVANFYLYFCSLRINLSFDLGNFYLYFIYIGRRASSTHFFFIFLHSHMYSLNTINDQRGNNKNLEHL